MLIPIIDEAVVTKAVLRTNRKGEKELTLMRLYFDDRANRRVWEPVYGPIYISEFRDESKEVIL